MATLRLCSIPDCGKRHFGRGWCMPHYKRWRRHGDPLLGNIAHGEALKYFTEIVLPYSGDECLKWPYSGVAGYGGIRIKGQHRLVHRLVCEHVNGPPPTPDHEAAHLCGKGNEGCCAARHLVWKTHAGNMADTVGHGTSTKGERNPLAKLTDDDIRAIRLMRGAAPHSIIAKQFGVSRSCIGFILQGKTWAHVK